MSVLSAFILTRFDRDEIIRQALEAVMRLSGSHRGFIVLGAPPGLSGRSPREAEDPDARNEADHLSRSDSCVVMSLSGDDPGLEPITSAAPLLEEAACRSVPVARGRVVVLPLLLSYAPKKEKLGAPERQMSSEPLKDPIGFLGLERTLGSPDYDPATITGLDVAARGYAALLAGTLLAITSETDRLTGLITRGCFFRLLPMSVRTASDASHPLALMLLDIRRLDAVNRLAGREKGDDVLRLVGRVLRDRLRDCDILARCGGDEFVAALTGCNEEEALLIAERLRNRFDEETRRAALPPVAVNIGLAVLPGHATDAGDLYHRAGLALAAAKRLGPGRVLAWREAHAAVKERVDRLEGLLMGNAAEDYSKVLTLVDTISEVNSSPDSAELLRKLLDRMIEATDAERALLLRHADGGDLKVEIARDRTRADLDSNRVRYSRKIVERSLLTGEPFCSITSAEDPSRSFQILRLRTAIGVPLAGRSGVLGVVYLDSREEPARYPAPMLAYLKALAHQVTLVLERTTMIEDLERKQRENEVLNRRLRERVNAQDEQIVAIQGQLELTQARTDAEPRIILPTSGPMRKILEIIDSAARTDAAVLLTGETGVGKEVLAQELHRRSRRARGPFVPVNCAAIPQGLIESEFFGHARGAFTGAEKERCGLFETAHGGTLFLDEVSATDPGFQAKLLRALQEGAIRRVGESRDREVDVRVVAAANIDLAEAIRRGTFREDLYYRLTVFSVRVPALRERVEEIPALARAALREACARSGAPEIEFDPGALVALTRHAWPGNVRELRNVIERLAATAREPTIGEADVQHVLDTSIRMGSPQAAQGTLPAPESAAQATPSTKAENILKEMIASGRSFWDAARAPYLGRELTRDDLRALIALGLAKSGGSYKRAALLFNLPSEDHKRFLDFIHNHDLRANPRGIKSATGV